MSNRQRVEAAVSEFLHAWTCGGKASLHLDTSDGGCTVSFTAHLGHPGALLLPTPPPAAPILRHRGRADKERNRQRAAAHQAAKRATPPISSSAPVITPAATVSVATIPASASAAPSSTLASASVAPIPATAPAASTFATVSVVTAISSSPIMSYACATAPLASSPSPAPVSRKPACCSSCGLPVRGHKGPLGSRCPAQESLRGAEGDTSLNTSPGKDGERDVNCWNCEVPLTPTHQCDEVVNCDEFNYKHHGKYRDERGVSYNSSSDASDIAQRCPECPECSVERHAALFREK